MAASSDETQPDPFVERLWIVRNGHRSLAADLYRDRDGWEVRFMSDGQCFAADASASRELVIRYADVLRQTFIADGWQS